MADINRMNAAFAWVSQFYGPQVELSLATDPADFWREHILSLAFLCKTKVAGKHEANSDIEAYNTAKEILQIIDEQNTKKMDRWKELEPEAAAKGNHTEIYKFIVLLLHNVCNFVDDYITESQDFLIEHKIERPFADLLRDVNSDTFEWWQGEQNLFNSPQVLSTSTEDSPFTKFSAVEIPSTPRTPFLKRGSGMTLSPIQSAIYSPITMKIRQDEYKKMRQNQMEMDVLLEFERDNVLESRKQAERFKQQAIEWREKYEVSEAMKKELDLERHTLKEEFDQLRRMNEKLVNEGRDYKLRHKKTSEELELLRKENSSIIEEKEHNENMKKELEKRLRDITDENRVLNEAKRNLDETFTRTKKEKETLTREIGEKEATIKSIREEHRRILYEMEENGREAMSREAELRLKLQKTKSELEELGIQLSNKEIELKEKEDAMNRQLNAVHEKSRQQIEQFEEKTKKLQTILTQRNEMLSEREKTIQELMQKLVDGYTNETENHKLQTDLQQMSSQIYQLNIEKSDLIKKVGNLNDEKTSLVMQLEEKSREIRIAFERMEDLEQKIIPMVMMIEQQAIIEAAEKLSSRPVTEVKEQKDIKVEREEIAIVKEEEETIDKNIQPIEEENEYQDDGDLRHLDCSLDEDDAMQYVSINKSIAGTTDFHNVIKPADSKELNFEVDRERVNELQRRNKAFPPALRSSYVLETVNYNSPSGNEQNIQAMSEKRPLQSSFSHGTFKVPFSPATSLSSIVSDDKENSILFQPPSEHKLKNRRKSFIHSFLRK